MEENTNEIKNEQAEKLMERRHYTKQQNALYTIISIALFFLLYFGGGQVIKLINRPYYTILTDISAESSARMFEYAGVDGQGLTIENARLDKAQDGYSVLILFSGLDSEEKFAENGITFEYGDLVEDVRIEFLPYEDNPGHAEYAFGNQYVDIDNPGRLISVFKFDGRYYAQYAEYGSTVTSEIKSIFAGGEKVYGNS